MGCQQSTPVVTTEGKTERRRTTVGATERLLSNRQKSPSERERNKRSLKQQPDVKLPPKLDSNGQLMPEEVVKRTTCSHENTPVKVGTPGKSKIIKLQYAYWTQQGWYPDDPHKENQDEYSITHKFGAEDGDILFGVYDGHGMEGHTCARYAKKHLPALIAKYVRKKRVVRYQSVLKAQNQSVRGSFNPRMWPKLSEKDYEDACRRAFVECNDNMHEDDTVPDKLSGTTAITAGFHFGRLTVCNVGDSRAILGHRTSEEEREEEKTEISAEPVEYRKLIAIPLSTDQTPYRKDERERVKKEGSSVMSIDQMEGREHMHENWGDLNLGEEIDVNGDPPRVWARGCDYPGCAFTRSLGDSIADDIGVYAVPEILTKELTSNDEILVIASDGIFEFLTNQAVIDMCAECESPLIACERLVKASYAQWLHYEDRTDDITLIVCFLQCESTESSGSGTTNELDTLDRSRSPPQSVSASKRKTDGRSLSLYVPEEGAEELNRRVLADMDASSDDAAEEKKITDSIHAYDATLEA